jgi:STAS-like domain of unknown function (DUF4325)
MKVIDYVGKYGSLRQFAIDLFNVVETLPEKEVELDFIGVEFCGRGFAHEFLRQMKKCSKQCTITNQNKDVAYMFFVAAHPRPKTKIV